MRIDASQSLPEVQAESVANKPVSRRVQPEPEEVEASGTESTFAWSRIQQQLDSIADVRPARVASLTQQLADGTYQVSGQAIASAMLDDLAA